MDPNLFQVCFLVNMSPGLSIAEWSLLWIDKNPRSFAEKDKHGISSS